jgi:hypothetical protein
VGILFPGYIFENAAWLCNIGRFLEAFCQAAQFPASNASGHLAARRRQYELSLRRNCLAVIDGFSSWTPKRRSTDLVPWRSGPQALYWKPYRTIC